MRSSKARKATPTQAQEGHCSDNRLPLKPAPYGERYHQTPDQAEAYVTNAQDSAYSLGSTNLRNRGAYGTNARQLCVLTWQYELSQLNAIHQWCMGNRQRVKGPRRRRERMVEARETTAQDATCMLRLPYHNMAIHPLAPRRRNT